MPSQEEIDGYADKQYHHDIEKLRLEFASVRTWDDTNLKQWFETHPYLSVYDNCRIANVSSWTIHMWRKRLGLTKPTGKKIKQREQSRVVVAPPPPAGHYKSKAWREWAKENYGKYSAPGMARACGIAYMTMRDRLIAIGIKLRSPREALKPKHPCCNRSWLIRHYVILRITKAQCAKLAGVSDTAIVAWLNRYGIRIRASNESRMTTHNGSDLAPEAKK